MGKKILILVITIILVVLICLGVGYWVIDKYTNLRVEEISQVKAIEIMQNRFPELKEYPSDKLPPKSIKVEKADDGWYVAFVQEGSGVQVIDARCYWVKNNNKIMQKDYTPKDNTFVGEFSAKDCTLAAREL